MKKPLLFLLIISILPHLSCSKEVTPDYESIVTAVGKAYSGFTTYRDTGIVSVHYEGTFPGTTTRRFRTACRNNGQFRFEFMEDGSDENHYIIHQDIDKTVQSWWGISSQVNAEANIAEALASASGVTDQTSLLVPPFLFPDDFDSYSIFKTLAGMYVDAGDIVDGEPCYVIAGYNLFNDLCKVYIQKDNYLIRRYTDGHQYETFTLTRIIDFYPHLNAGITDEELLFGHP